MRAPILVFTILGLTVSLVGFLFGNTIGELPPQSDIRQRITTDCYSIADAAQDYYGRPVLLGSGARNYSELDIADCGVEMTGTGYRGETDIAIYTVEGNAARFTVTGVSKADARRTVTLSCLMYRPDGKRYSLVTANW